MDRRRKTLLRWLLRLAGLSLVVFVVLTQVRWHDELRLVDGSVLQGHVERIEAGGFSVRTADGARRTVGPEEVAQRGDDVPHVAWGFRTLGGRALETPATGVIVLLSFILIICLMGWRWERLLAAIDVRIPLRESIRLTFIGGFFNLVIPGSTGGDVVKAYYAAKRSGRPTRSVLSVFVDRIIGVLMLVFVAALAMLYLEWTGQGGIAFRTARIAVFSLLAGGVFGLLVLASQRVRRGLGLSALIRRLPLQHIVGEIGASIRLYRGQKRLVLLAFGLSFVNQAGFALLVWALADALAIQGVTALNCLALVPLMNLLAAVPLLPGGWGVGELAFAFFFGQVGVPATEAVGLSVLFRLSFMFVNLPGGLFWALARDQDSRAEIEAAVDQASGRVGGLGVSPSKTPEDDGVDVPADGVQP